MMPQATDHPIADIQASSETALPMHNDIHEAIPICSNTEGRGFQAAAPMIILGHIICCAYPL